MNVKTIAGLILVIGATVVGVMMLMKPASGPAPVANIVESLSGKRIDLSDYAPGNAKYKSSGGSGGDKTVELKVGERVTVVAPTTLIKGGYRDENYDVIASGFGVVTQEFIEGRPSNEKTFKAVAGGKAELDLATHGTGLISSYYKIIVNVEGPPGATPATTPTVTPSPRPSSAPSPSPSQLLSPSPSTP